VTITVEAMREYLMVHAPELKVVELTEAHTTDYIAREWKVLPAQVAKNTDIARGQPRDDRRYLR
jgi:hypothetical protein